MNFSQEMIEKAKTAASAEELLEMAAGEGIALSAAEAERYFGFLTQDSQPLSDEELEMVAGGKGGKKKPKPNPKYAVGRQLWIAYPSTHTYVGIVILEIEFYLESDGWRYLVKDEDGLLESYYLDDNPFVRTYKPKGWEEDKIHR